MCKCNLNEIILFVRLKYKYIKGMEYNCIDSLRGLACIFLVIYHVIGGTPEQGLHIASGFLREANDILAYIRMPLFTFLSGYVYSLRPIGNTSSSLFLRSKARRLLIPMLVAGTLFAFIQYNVDSSNMKISNLYMLHVIPVAHFWFVESLFVIFLFIVFIEKINLINCMCRFICIFIISVLVFLTVPAPAYFGLNGVVYLLPFFLFGIGVGRFKVKFNLFLLCALYLILIACTFVFFGVSHIGIDRQTPISLFVGIAACYLLINLNLRSVLLSFVGSYSYSIYLYHVFFSASSRMAISLFTVNIFIHLLVGMLCAVIGPILFEKILYNNRLFNTLFFGKRFTGYKNMEENR